MLFLLPSPKPSALLEVRGPNPGDRVARRPHSCGRRIQCGTSCRRPVLASLGGLGKDVRGQEWVPGKRMGRAEEPCLHSPMSLPVLYPLYKCAEIKRNASEKRELQGNRELAARPSGSAVIAKCQSAVCQHPPPSPSLGSLHRGGWWDSQPCLLQGQTELDFSGADRASFYLLLSFGNCSLSSPFRERKSWGKSLGPGGIFC